MFSKKLPDLNSFSHFSELVALLSKYSLRFLIELGQDSNYLGETYIQVLWDRRGSAPDEHYKIKMWVGHLSYGPWMKGPLDNRDSDLARYEVSNVAENCKEMYQELSSNLRKYF